MVLVHFDMFWLPADVLSWICFHRRQDTLLLILRLLVGMHQVLNESSVVIDAALRVPSDRVNFLMPL